MKQRLIGLVVALASVGWLVPLWLGAYSCLELWRVEISPLLAHTQPPLHSFPYLEFATNCFALAFIWLSLVGFCWAYAIAVWLLGAMRPNNSFKPKPLRGSA